MNRISDSERIDVLISELMKSNNLIMFLGFWLSILTVLVIVLMANWI